MMAQAQHRNQRQLKLRYFESVLFMQYFYEIPRNFQIVLYALGFYSYIGSLQLPKSNEILTLRQSQFNYQNIVLQLSRIDIPIITQFDLDNYQYLITLSIMLIFFILPLLLVFGIKKRALFQQYTSLYLFIVVSSIFSQIFSHYLYLPLLYISVHSVTHIIDSSDLQITHLFFVILTILIVLISQIMRQITCLKSFDYKINSFQQLNTSFLDLAFQVFLIIQVLSYVLIESPKYALIIQSIVIAIISITKIMRIFEQYTCNKAELQIAFFISSYGLTSSIITLALQIFDNYQSFNNSITLLTFLFIYSGLFQYFLNYETKQMLRIVNDTKKSAIKYYFAKIINQQFHLFQLLLIHCLISKEYRSKREIQVKQIYPENNLETLEENVEAKFFIKKLTTLSKIVLEEKNFDIDYISILYQLKFHNLAYKQIMIAFNLNLINKINQHSQSYQSESVQKFKSLHDKKLPSLSTLRKSVKSNSEEINNVEQKIQHKRNKLLLPIRNRISLMEEAQLKWLREYIRQEIQTKYQIINNKKQNANEIQQVVKIYLQNEKRNDRLRQDIINLFGQKISFYAQFTNKKIIDHFKLFNSARNLSSQLYSMEQKLIKRYEQYPSHKIQSILIYMQAELLNNFIEAYRFKNLTSISDQQLIDLDQNLQISLFSKEVIYINAVQIENDGELQILNNSQNTQKYFEMTDEQFKDFTSISYILPDFITTEHNILVNQFIQTGYSKFYLQYSPTFYKYQGNFIKQCDLLFDVHYDDKYLYKFSIFIQNSTSSFAYFFLDINEQIGGVTDFLFEKLKYSNQFIDMIRIFDFKMVSIIQILPEFSVISSERRINVQTTFQFIKESIFIQFYEKPEHKQSISSLWNDKNNLNFYIANIVIQYQNIYDYYYYIIEIRDITQKLDDQYVTIQGTDHMIDVEKHFELSQLTESEALANLPKDFKLNNQKHQDYNYQLKNNTDNLFEQQQVQFINNQEFEPNLLSPNSSQQMLNMNLSSQIRIQQQDYFNSSLHDMSYSLQKSAKLQLFQEQEFKDIPDKKEKAQFYEQQAKKDSSLTSKQTGLQKSAFYKKYELVQDTLSQSFPSSADKMLTLNLVSLGIKLIFYIIVLVLVTEDLNKFIAEIDMIQLHSGVMVPHDFYFQMRFSIFTYTGYLNNKVITKDRFNNLTGLLYDNMYIGYYGFKDGFLNQLNNKYLQPFYNDKNITVYYMKEFGLNTYPVTFNIREVYFTFLTYYYDFLLRFNSRLSPANQTYQIFQFANVYGVHYVLEDLAQEAWAYSKTRSVTVKDKWNSLWIIFLTVSFLPMLLALYYLRIFRQLYDKYLNLFRYCSTIKVQREIERCKFQAKVLRSNAGYLYFYRLDVDSSEEHILNEKYILDKEQEKYKNSKFLLQFKQLAIIQYIILIVGIWIVFLLFSLFTNLQVQRYLDKYPDSCDLYKQLQNMSLSTGAMPRNREFKLQFSTFPYIREEDGQRFYETMASSQVDVSTFLNLCLTFNPDLYYSSDNFLNYFYSVQKSNVCSLLVEEIGFLSYYCNISFSGNLQFGLLPTIKYLSNEINVEQDINNYTKRVEYYFYEMEGGLIIMRAFQKMSTVFKSGMITVTQEQINITNVIVIIILGFIYMLYYIQYYHIYLVWNDFTKIIIN